MAFADSDASTGRATGSGALTPSLDVSVDGTTILGALWGQVSAVEVEDDLGLPGAFSIELPPSAVPSEPSTWLEDDKQFALGAKVKIQLGLNGQRAVVMDGEITALEPSFDAAHGPRLTLRGYDKRHRLQRGSRTQSYQGTTDSEIVKKLADAAGIDVDEGNSSLHYDYLLQANQSDLDFLNARADAINYEMLMIDGRLVFRPVAFDAGASAVIQYGSEVQELHFSLSVAMQPTKVVVRAWNVADNEVLVGDAEAGSERSRMGGKRVAAAVADKAFGAVEDGVVTFPAANQAEVDARAAATYSRAALQLLSVEGLCTGRNDLRAGIVAEIKGVGSRYGGLYYLHSVKHSYSVENGYQTRFQGRRNAL